MALELDFGVERLSRRWLLCSRLRALGEFVFAGVEASTVARWWYMVPPLSRRRREMFHWPRGVSILTASPPIEFQSIRSPATKSSRTRAGPSAAQTIAIWRPRPSLHRRPMSLDRRPGLPRVVRPLAVPGRRRLLKRLSIDERVRQSCRRSGSRPLYCRMRAVYVVKCAIKARRIYVRLMSSRTCRIQTSKYRRCIADRWALEKINYCMLAREC